MRRKHSIHRVLILRLASVTLGIALILMALVVWVELRNIDRAVLDQSAGGAERLRWAILNELDTPDLGDHARIQRTLDKGLSGRIRLPQGSFVLVRILDRDFKEVAKARDPSYAHIKALNAYVAKGVDYATLKKSGFWNRISRIEGQAVIYMGSVLKNSRGEPVGYIEGVYAIAPGFLKNARMQAAISALIAMCIVLITSLMLYPVINRLLSRVASLNEDLLHANMEILNVLGSAIAKRDSDTDIHNYRVTIYAVRTAEVMGIEDGEMRSLIKGAFLHDVGKIGISDAILLKPGSLTAEEFEEIKKHVRHGLDIVARSTWLQDAAAVVGGHHEQFDGRGYIERLADGEIPRVARIFAVADVFDALTSKRPYKEPFPYEDAKLILEDGRGHHFDPAVLDAFFSIAPGLYAEYANRDDARTRDDMQRLAERYFQPGHIFGA